MRYATQNVLRNPQYAIRNTHQQEPLKTPSNVFKIRNRGRKYAAQKYAAYAVWAMYATSYSIALAWTEKQILLVLLKECSHTYTQSVCHIHAKKENTEY